MAEPTYTMPRGMKDIEPDEMAKRIWVNNKIMEVFKKYGFQIVEPTPIESLETLEAKCGPAIRDEIYWFKDKSGRNLGLRFDLTVGMARMVANRYDLPIPIKIGAISGMWRYDEPQFGRYRHFYQWDAEIFGSEESAADAEAVALGMDILENFGLKEYEVRASSRKLVDSLLARTGIISPEILERTIVTIDKVRKIPEQEIIEEFKRIGLAEDKIKQIIDFASMKGKPDSILAELSRKIPEENRQGLDELSEFFEVLGAFKKTGKCILDLSVVRGIGYYDGIVFEAYDKGGEDIGAIFGGGRYDKLCRLYGKQDLPATGVAGGIERLMMSLERAGLLPELPQTPKVAVIAVTDEVRKKAFEIAQYIRSKGISADVDLRKRSLKKQLEYADAMKIPYAIIIGPEELKKGTVKLRDMKKRLETETKIEEMPRQLSK